MCFTWSAFNCNTQGRPPSPSLGSGQEAASPPCLDSGPPCLVSVKLYPDMQCTRTHRSLGRRLSPSPCPVSVKLYPDTGKILAFLAPGSLQFRCRISQLYRVNFLARICIRKFQKLSYNRIEQYFMYKILEMSTAVLLVWTAPIRCVRHSMSTVTGHTRFHERTNGTIKSHLYPRTFCRWPG